MPYRSVYIPVNVLPELEKYGFNSYGNYERIYKNDKEYLEFKSEKGDIGAILARCGVPKEKIGLCVTIVQQNGGYVEDVYYNLPSDVTPLMNQNLKRPRQQALPGIFESAPYDETSHLTPNGKKRRKRR